MKRVLILLLAISVPAFFPYLLNAQTVNPDASVYAVAVNAADETADEVEVVEGQLKPIYRDGSDFYFYDDPVPLSSYEVMELFGREVYNETYVGAVKQMKVGKPLIITGVSIAAVGITLAIAGAVGESDDLMGIGVIAGAVGVTTMSVGAPLFCVGRARLNWMAEDYNARQLYPEFTVNFGPQRHGVGFSINF